MMSRERRCPVFHREPLLGDIVMLDPLPLRRLAPPPAGDDSGGRGDRGSACAGSPQSPPAECPFSARSALWPPSLMRSLIARMTPETTNTRWIVTCHIRLRSDMLARFMKALSTWIAEMATIDDRSLSFRPVKSILPIHSGQSLCVLSSILETKFS